MKPNVLRFGNLLGVSLGLLLASLCGCFEEKESLHESDHYVPAHWPSSIIDAAKKVEDHLSYLETYGDVPEIGQQLTDLTEWIPEVAADTDLEEPDWVPIYNLCETIRRHILKEQLPHLELRGDYDRLVGLLREADKKLASE